ncbi:DUF4760 domain-containing protein [Pseudomonas granadensis]|uniref:DUF4760 domain-containing protein n=1 Tax=Pseudomonas granadensis TaxID=1421430 RepID=A0ABX7GIB8_9PSED|nr:DUF4760 domain-containing protein [Pseudomonas granadensis]QRK85091.1 DUF4760 domain-containing protein [Pseudomonas granadensis]
MNKFWIGVSATCFILGIIIRLVLLYSFPAPLPFPLDIVDAFMVASGGLTAVMAVHQFIKSKYADTAEMLPLFSTIIWTVIVSSYVILRYAPTYQTSLSILVTGTFVGMGWWIQAITTAANTRRTHTLNIIMASRTSSEYQEQTRNSGKIYRASAVCAELAEWRFSPNKDEFKYTEVPDAIDKAISGTIYVLNYFEFLAQGIKYRDLDDCLLRECFSAILAGIERRGFHLIIEAQKGSPTAFEGLIRLTKEWNGESCVEKYRSNPDNSAIGVRYPIGNELQDILNAKKPLDAADVPTIPTLVTNEGVLATSG